MHFLGNTTENEKKSHNFGTAHGSFHYNSTNGEHPYLLKFDYVLIFCNVFKTNLISVGIFLISFFVFEILGLKNLHFFH